MSAIPNLTDNEGSVLGLVVRREPISTYQLLRIFEESPVSSLNDSKGTIYPVVRRLKARGLLSGRALQNDRRRTELLRCTAEGKKALREWIMAVPRSAILMEDPLRTRLLCLDLIAPGDRERWAREILDMVMEKIEEVEAFAIGLQIPFQELVLKNLTLSLEARRAWLSDMVDAFAAKDRQPASLHNAH